jgi:uncharacterized protein YyaL (SSP411 family)
MTTRAAIRWQAWTAEAFAEAHATGRPVLLSIHVAWSEACRRMDEEAFADPAVVARVAAGLVPIRVDADRRPDIADRYCLGGWPTTAFLTPDGECLGGGTFVDGARLSAALAHVADAFAARRDELWRGGLEARRARQARRTAGDPVVDADAPARVAALLAREFDETWAGFGTGAKTPEVAPVELALRHGVSAGDEPLVDLAVRTLDRFGWSSLSDAALGAFHRACATRDWEQPESACQAGLHADLVRLFLDAGETFGDGDYLDRARAGLGFVERTLADRVRPGVAASAEVAGGTVGHVDRTRYTDVTARLVRAYVRAGDVLGEARWTETAVAMIEQLVPAVYSPGAGVGHWLDETGAVRGRGLLTDQVHLSSALVDVAIATGVTVYVELAEELMRSCLRRFHLAPGAGLRDRVPSRAGGGDIGLLAEPVVPFALNCEAASVLSRLASDAGRGDLAVKAREVLASQTPVYPEHGVLGAAYALAAAELIARGHA